MKKLLCFFVLGGIMLFSGCGLQPEPTPEVEPLTLGAILPMTGPGALWGESIQNGLELTKKMLADEGVEINIVYANSQASPKEGVTAYNVLKAQHNPDAYIVAFSRVAVPLIDLAHQDQKPLFMTLVAADGAADKSPYAFRFFSKPQDFVYNHFQGALTKDAHPSLSLLYVNDEYGASVAQAVRDAAQANDVEILTDENFAPGTVEFRSYLSKVKAASSSALVLIGSVPPEVLNPLQQVGELNVKATFFEASLYLALNSMRSKVAHIVDGGYTNSYPFTLRETGHSFFDAYKDMYDEEPIYTAAFAHDITRLLVKASPTKIDGAELQQKILDIGAIQSLNGLIKIEPNGEINPKIYSVQIKDGELVK